MSKNIIIKFVIVLVVSALAYSLFWFFKVGQLEKQISNFVNENSTYASIGEVSVSGFPLKQKITVKNLKFTIPTSLSGGNQIIVKHIEAEAEIFSTDFVLTLKRDISVQGLEGKTAIVEFNELPVITASVAKGIFSNFNYSDAGYKILDIENNSSYSAGSTSVKIKASLDEQGQIKTKISTNIQDIEGFDVVDVYNNSFEKMIVDGIKTGEIALSKVPEDAKVVDAVQQLEGSELKDGVIDSAEEAAIALQDPNIKSPKEVINALEDLQEKVAAVQNTKVSELAKAAISEDVVKTDEVNPLVTPDQMEAPAIAEIVAPKVPEIVKSNFVLDIEYVLSPVKADQEIKVPVDPSQIQEIPVQYTKSITMNNLEFSNSSYKILINGNMKSSPEDTSLSGALTAKIENIDNVTSLIAESFSKVASGQDLAIDEVQAVDLMENEVEADNSYNDFLSQVSGNLGIVVKELSENNEMTKDNLAEFSIKREKNLVFLINGKSMREILGKF